MGSRLRENPSHLFECWCEVVAPQGTDHPPWVIQKFPRTYNEVEVLKNVPQFTYPCSFEKPTVQHFSFVLTNVDSKFLYGFCRHAPGTETALVVLSNLPWHKLFYNFLNHCAKLISEESEGNLWTFLQAAYQSNIPSPGGLCEVSYSDNKFFICESPNHLALPTIPEDRNLNEYFNAVDVENMIIIFASMLNERRIIVTSERVSKLSSCIQAANSLMYPMSWQHIFIPVLPEDLLDYLNAPMPFLIGVAWSLMKKVRIDDVGEVVILNADTNNVQTPFSDVDNLPDEVTSTLRKNLKPPNLLLGDNVARTFLRAIVQLIGNYREALQLKEEDKCITLNEEKFVSNRPTHFQPFVENMLHLQIFRQFIEERLQFLNSGLHTSDEFELEASVYGEKIPSNMKQILNNVKKESGAIMKKVKSKTNPAMKSAVKSVAKGSRNVKEKSKITYKGLRGKFKDMHALPKTAEIESSSNNALPTKPRSAPSSPTPSRRSKLGSGFYGDYKARVTYTRTSQGSSNKISNGDVNKRIERFHSATNCSEDNNKTPSPQEIDLIGELEAALKTNFGTSSPSLSQQKPHSICSTSSQAYTESNTSTYSVDSIGSSTLDAQSSPEKPPLIPLPNVDVNIFNPSKPISASLTSLPLLDLSLNIQLPPPLFPIQRGSCTLSTEGRRSRHHGRGGRYHTLDAPVNSTSDSVKFRSPKIVPQDDSDVSTNNTETLCISTLPRSYKEVCSINHTGSFLTSKKSVGSAAISLEKVRGTLTNGIVGAVNPLTCNTTSSTVLHDVTYSKCNPYFSVSGTNQIRFQQSLPPRSGVVFPRYDVNPSFSASLARFSARDGNASYFYSILSRSSSKSRENFFLETDPIIKSAKHSCSGKLSSHFVPLAQAEIPEHFNSFDDSLMSRSLPPGLASRCFSYDSCHPSSLDSLSSAPSRRRRPKPSEKPQLSTTSENGKTSQDLIFLEAPQDEIFDPLLSKELLPTTHSKKQERRLIKSPWVPNNSVEASSSISSSSSCSSATSLSTEIKALSPSRYLPFSSLQESSMQKAQHHFQNPLYNQHTPISAVHCYPQSSFNAPVSSPISTATTSMNNAAANFASSLIYSTDSQHEKPARSLQRRPYVNYTPPNLLNAKASLNEKLNSSKGSSLTGATSTDQLLGDFSHDFKKLSISKPEGMLQNSSVS